MAKKIQFIQCSDKEVIDNSCMVFLHMANKTNDDDYEYFLRKVIVYLNALSSSMKVDGVTSVKF